MIKQRFNYFDKYQGSSFDETLQLILKSNINYTIGQIKKDFEVDDEFSKELLFQKDLMNNQEIFDEMSLSIRTNYPTDYMERYGVCWIVGDALIKRRTELENEAYITKLQLLGDSKIELQNVIKSKISSLNPQERRKLLKEIEDTFVIGNPFKLLTAYRLSNYLNSINEYYECLGSLTSSFLAYQLGIHHVDTLKHKIDSRMCHGISYEDKYAISFRVGINSYSKVKEFVENDLFDKKPFMVFLIDNKGNKRLLKGHYVYLLNDEFIYHSEEVCDYLGNSYKAFDLELIKTNNKEFVRVNIYSSVSVSLINECRRKLNKFNFNEIENISSLNYLIKKGCTKSLTSLNLEEIKLNMEKCITFNDYVEFFTKKMGIFQDNDKAKLILTKDDLVAFLQNTLSEEKSFNLALSMPYNFSSIAQLDSNEYRNEIVNVNYLFNRSEIIQFVQRLCIQAKLLMLIPDFYYQTYFRLSHILIDSRNCVDIFAIQNRKRYENTIVEKILDEYQLNIVERFIGLFFIIDNNIIGYKERLKVSNKSLMFVNSDKGHFEFYDEIRKPGMKEEYSMYPRGRILYDTRLKIFKVFANKMILKNEDYIRKIKKYYNLGDINVVFDSDQHYSVLGY